MVADAPYFIVVGCVRFYILNLHEKSSPDAPFIGSCCKLDFSIAL
ncbi:MULTISPECIES: hypothetical protein [unclassified Microcoleus]